MAAEPQAMAQAAALAAKQDFDTRMFDLIPIGWNIRLPTTIIGL